MNKKDGIGFHNNFLYDTLSDQGQCANGMGDSVTVTCYLRRPEDATGSELGSIRLLVGT
jgi:hypothetical protein